MIRVGINGYGRIGRIAHRVILEKHSQAIEVGAINASSSTDVEGWMYLLKYDTVYGPLLGHTLSFSRPHGASEAKDFLGNLLVDGKEIPVLCQKEPSLLPWGNLKVEVVIEATGAFRTEEKLQAHLSAGAKKVILSAPVKPARNASQPARNDSRSVSGESDAGGEGNVGTFVLSVNDKNYKGESMINNASCTTNCIAPVAKIMLDNFGVEKAMMTTIHGFTSDQRLQDGGHKDYRRARAASQNIIPTSTGATTAAAKALPTLQNKFSGLAIRVPVVVGSLSDFTFVLKKNVTVSEINNVFKKEAQNTIYKGILEVTEEPLVSSDIIGNSASAIVDLSLTQVVGGNLVKVIAWYDNEWAYANRLVEEVLMVGSAKT